MKKTIIVAMILLSTGTNFAWWPFYSEDTPEIALIKAIYADDIDQAERLFDNNAPVHNKVQNALLLLAAKTNKINLLNKLIKTGSYINTQEGDQHMTALMYAAKNGYKKMVDLLILHGADIEAKNTFLKTALAYAVENGHLDIVKILLKNGANAHITNTDGWTLLMLAARNGYMDIVRLLLPINDINAQNHLGNTALSIAITYGHTDIVKFLIDNGANIHTKNHLDQTAQVYERYIDMLLGQTPLHLAVYGGHAGIVDLLLKQGADINAADNTGKTALIYAAEKGNNDIAKLLIRYGANVNAIDKWENTALSYAIFYGKPNMVKILLDNNAYVTQANMNTINAKLESSYMPACMRSNYHEIKDLLEKRTLIK